MKKLLQQLHVLYQNLIKIWKDKTKEIYKRANTDEEWTSLPLIYKEMTRFLFNYHLFIGMFDIQYYVCFLGFLTIFKRTLFC